MALQGQERVPEQQLQVLMVEEGLQLVLLLVLELQLVIGLGFWSSGGREEAVKTRRGIVASFLWRFGL